jgi:hypothetical protein
MFGDTFLLKFLLFPLNDFASNKCCTPGVSVTGVGIFFHHETHDGAKFPVVRSITEKGSASRQGSIATGEILLRVDGLSCRDWDSKELQNKVRSGSAMLNTCSIGGAVYYEEIQQELNRMCLSALICLFCMDLKKIRHDIFEPFPASHAYR